MIIRIKRAGEKISFALCRSNASHPDVAFASHPYVTQPYCALLQGKKEKIERKKLKLTRSLLKERRKLKEF